MPWLHLPSMQCAHISLSHTPLNVWRLYWLEKQIVYLKYGCDLIPLSISVQYLHWGEISHAQLLQSESWNNCCYRLLRSWQFSLTHIAHLLNKSLPTSGWPSNKSELLLYMCQENHIIFWNKTFHSYLPSKYDGNMVTQLLDWGAIRFHDYLGE